MLLAMGPTEAFKEDAYFIQALRKGAVNEVASAIFQELKAEIRQEALVEEQNKMASEAQSTKSEVTPTENGVTRVVLEHQTV